MNLGCLKICFYASCLSPCVLLPPSPSSDGTIMPPSPKSLDGNVIPPSPPPLPTPLPSLLLLLLSGTIPSFCEQPNHQYPAGRGNGGSALSI